MLEELLIDANPEPLACLAQDTVVGQRLVEFVTQEPAPGGSEDALAAALGVPKSRFKHIKKLANQKELDFRHATSGEPIGADAADIQQAREEARELVQKFIELLCDEEAKRRALAAASVGPTRSN